MSNNALWQTLRAPIAHFDVTPLGRMIYRFTRDIDALDNNLVLAVQQMLINGGSLIGSYALIVAYFYYVSPPLPARSPPTLQDKLLIVEYTAHSSPSPS